MSVQFPSGSFVLVSNVTRRNKWEPLWEGPYVVIRRNMAGSYRLRCPASGMDIGAPVPPERLKAIKVSSDVGTTLEVDHIVEHVKDEQGDVLTGFDGEAKVQTRTRGKARRLLMIQKR